MKAKGRIIFKSLFSIVFFGFLFQLQNFTNSQTVNENSSAELDNFFLETLDSQKYVALGACLINKDRVIWDGYYGYADLENKIPLKRESIFPLMSISKTVTALALLMLYEEGLFGLDEDINKYLPFEVKNPNFPDKSISFRMLLNHTAGFEDVTPTGLRIPEKVGRPQSSLGDSKTTLEEYIKELFTPEGKYYSTEYFSTFEPGTKYGYSNIGYSLIGYLVEKIAKQDFAEFCKTKIFFPLEMKNTGWHLKDVDTSLVIFTYNFSPQDTIPNYRKVKHFGEPGYPAGMLRSTMNDFVNYIVMILNDGQFGNKQIVKRETIELLLAPQDIKNIPSAVIKFLIKV